MAKLIGYGGAFGQESCPGQEMWDPDIGACMCPPGMQTTGTIGECVPESQSVPAWAPQGGVCPTYVKLSGPCLCPDGHAYDAATQMCTREAYGPQPAPAPPRPRSTSVVATAESALAGMGVGGWVLLAVVAGGVAYLAGRSE
jgi:hypothetical protein